MRRRPRTTELTEVTYIERVWRCLRVDAIRHLHLFLADHGQTRQQLGWASRRLPRTTRTYYASWIPILEPPMTYIRTSSGRGVPVELLPSSTLRDGMVVASADVRFSSCRTGLSGVGLEVFIGRQQFDVGPGRMWRNDQEREGIRGVNDQHRRC